MQREKTERFPIPEELPERFMGIIYSMVEPFGIDKLPDVMHYVELLGQAVDRQTFDAEHSSKDRSVVADRKKFIAIFKTRFLHATDYEYGRPVVPAEAKLIGQVIDMVGTKGFEVDEFLRWVFEVFFEENPKFNPPTIKFVCSQFVVDKFLFENREVMKQRQVDESRKKDALDVIGRARAEMRAAKDSGRQEDLGRMVEMLKRYRDGSIMIGELRAEVEKAEAESRSRTGGQ